MGFVRLVRVQDDYGEKNTSRMNMKVELKQESLGRERKLGV